MRSGARRSGGASQYYPGNPVLRPDRPWESEGGSPTAMVFSDGVWYDGRYLFVNAAAPGGELRVAALDPAARPSRAHRHRPLGRFRGIASSRKGTTGIVRAGG